MAGRGEQDAPARRTITYCVVPRELAPKLHETLRRHFSAEPSVEVVVEQRRRDRRAAGERRAEANAVEDERRRIRNLEGRRVADRRAIRTTVGAPVDLPRRARGFADRLVFIERVEPTDQHLEDIDTARLVTRIQGGESELFAELYMRYFDRIYGYLRVVFRDEHEAEDVTQQVFTKVLEVLPSYERRSQPFRAWLFIVVRNHAITRLRERNRLDMLDPAEVGRRRECAASADEELSVLGWISDRDLLLFIERLPLAQRQVLMLRFMLGLSHVETAQVLGRSQEDVRGLQHRALSFLRARLTALGRAPAARGGEVRMRRRPTQLRVLRLRRFSLL